MLRPICLIAIFGLLVPAAFLTPTGMRLSGRFAPQNDTSGIIVPVGGNSWLVSAAKNGKEQITEQGWINWQNPRAVFATYVGVKTAGSLQVWISINVPFGTSTLNCTISGASKTVAVRAKGLQQIYLGEWQVQPGYVKIETQGISRTAASFGIVDAFILRGAAISQHSAYVKNNEGNYFYWGRRGPSVHINYDVRGAGNEIEWFYNEITVPRGFDPVGSYFMANGFGEGYFGIQVNSSRERRILFSVWSPFETDDPSKIPDDRKIRMLKKGKSVHAGEFGNEGSGGQSYLQYPWKTGITYGFLLRGHPVENGATEYTAWFYDPQSAHWILIASFARPQTQTFLTKLHSFLENFEPITGTLTRKALYSNQWVADGQGAWRPLEKMIFTGDQTAKKGYRMDYAGGTTANSFFLQNDGFFNDSVKLKTEFRHPPGDHHPEIDFTLLP